MQCVERIISATIYDKKTGDKIMELPIETFIDIGFNQEFPIIKEEDNQNTIID